MDFGELPRGGTAPAASKARTSSVPTSGTMHVRPKTRAIDNDLHDTNLELKTNRIKPTNTGTRMDYGEMYFEDMEAVRASPNLNYEASDPSSYSSYNRGGLSLENPDIMMAKPPSTAAPRAPSRNRVSKDPKRVQNNLVTGLSGLSAYTQNIMVLHPTKKAHKPSAVSSPRPPRDNKSNYMNDIRNAYGADLPFGKPSSPNTRPKSKSSSNEVTTSNIKHSDSYESDEYKEVTKPAAKAVRKRSIGNDEGLQSASASPPNLDEEATRPNTNMYNARPIGGLKLPSNNSTPDHSNASSPSTRKAAASKKAAQSGLGNLLKSSLTSNNNNNNNSKPSPAVRTIELERSSPTLLQDHSNSNSAVTVNSADFTEQPTRRTHHDFEDDHIHEEEELKRVISREGTRRKSSPLTMSHVVEVDSMQTKARAVSFHEEEDAVPAANYSHSHSHSQHATKHIGEKQLSMNSEELEQLINQRTSSTSSPDNVPYTKYTQHQSRHTPPSYRRDEDDDIDHYLDGTDDLLGFEDHSSPQLLNLAPSGVISTVEEMSGDAADGSGPSRPQSRKLYLGNEKVPPPQTSPVIKAPRSAGARYASQSPSNKAGNDSLEVDSSKLKRLSSFNDLRQSSPWQKDEHLLNERPPSRQSSAFPVHLAEEPSSNKKRGEPTIPVINTAMPTMQSNLRKNNEDVLNLVSSLAAEEENTNATTSVSIKASSVPVQPNTEPRLIGKKAKLQPPPSTVSAEMDQSSMVSSPFDNRPPSRQKIAAQHLFDDGKGEGGQPSVPMTSAGGRRPTGEGRWQEAAPGTRSSTTRGGAGRSNMTYDPREDGFLELGPEDKHVPFAISVNYGPSSDFSSSSSVNRRSVRSMGNGNNLGNDDIVNVMNEKFSEVSLISMNSNKDRSIKDGRKSSAGNNKYSEFPSNYEPTYGNYGLSPVRPKSVSATANNNNMAKTNKMSSGKAKSPIYYDSEEVPEQLRSKSANHYVAHGRDRMMHSNHMDDVDRINPSTPVTAPKNNKPNPRAKAATLNSNSAWSEQDPRNIPRAQNTFGLGADSGWTSPSLIAQPYNSSPAPNTFGEYNRDFSPPQDDDDMTILTEDSGHNMDHSMSMQSFPLESSLGEDFLSLFAPAGR